MLLVRAAILLALAAVPMVAGCAADDASADREWEPEINGKGGGKGGSCAPQTCSSAGKTCGTHDDGCGGQIDCGKCVDEQCTPKTCKELNKTCGKVDDGCGGLADCGQCAACAPDAKAGNSAAEKASDLGAMTDSPVTNKRIDALSLGENEEDWFKFKVSDKGFGGNPLIKATASGGSVEVSAFYLCESESNNSECPVEGEKPDTTVGAGCKGASTASVWTGCGGITEDGTAFVRVRKAAGATQQCVSYALDVAITQKLF